MKIYAVLTPAAIALLTQNAVSAPRQLPIQTSGGDATPIQITETAAPQLASTDKQRPNPTPYNDPASWAGTFDYPVKALAEQREGTTGFTVQVGPDGRVQSCAVTLSSGHNDLDEATCSSVTRRGRFNPALDAVGRPTIGKWSSRVRWKIPTVESSATVAILSESFPRPPKLLDVGQLRISKDQYPASALNEGRQGTTRFAVLTDVTGKVQDCSVSITSGHADLDQKACEIAQRWDFEPARNLNGEPVAGKSAHTLNWRLPQKDGAPPSKALRDFPNPLQNTGVVTITVDLDASGKTMNCFVEHSGEITKQASLGGNSQALCNLWRNNSFKPIVDEDGAAKAVRIVQKVMVEHQAIPPKPQPE